MITIRKSNLIHTDKIYSGIKIAKEFLSAKYPEANLQNVEFIFGGGKRSRYFRNANNSKYTTPTVFICCRSIWGTYKMKSLKVYADWIDVGIEKKIIFSLIHEMTHHIQYELQMPKGEKETTKNELEFCRIHYPEIYSKLKSIK